MDRAIDLVFQSFQTVLLRGDTDFSQTAHLDRWHGNGIKFVFGIDAMPNLNRIAGNLDEKLWKALTRRTKRVLKTEPRQRPANVKEKIVSARKFKNKKLESEPETFMKTFDHIKRLKPCQT